MALQIIQFHSLQMKIEKKASASEMCHSDHWNAPNGDPLRLFWLVPAELFGEM